MTTKVLLVEDSQGIQDMMKYAVEQEGYELLSAMTVEDGWNAIETHSPNLVLLDWMLPDSSGIDLLRRIRKTHPELPVIMVTAKTQEHERIQGLDVGADDYVTKPFSVKELLARIRALLRRTKPGTDVIQVGDLVLDSASYRVTVNNSPLELAPTEFRLLHFLMSNSERAFSRGQLLDQVWGTNVYVEERTVDVHVRRLRKHLEPHGLKQLIQTVHGHGYRFSAKG
ncbi:MAG: phosphate regulon transcriptional regulator PhoB [bacterium]